MDNIVSNHIVQQQQQQQPQQFVVPMQNAKFVVNTVNMNQPNNPNVNHAVNHAVNHNINHVVNNQTPTLMKGNAPSMKGSAADHAGQVVTPARIHELAREVDPSLQLDEEVEETLQGLTENFVDSVINGATLLAKHRHAPTIEVKDIQLYLERTYNMWIPGFGTDELRPYKRASLTEAHKQRLALIRRALKKY